ncbi:GNAT family N-acetyltransferase [Streptomyces sp. NPDC059506]|uniref:GNAT family N-acetyltransferase n=1 Tax=unclassified Streptomyces TaxID=2593676 RepID=UPI0022AA49B7|nr:GNAT family N-acetyltransferase [Streptomyces sp. HB2AG]MCZ2524055.1 GNAT family N-acetyltransferase [Streptomyces sp. HB2AG]
MLRGERISLHELPPGEAAVLADGESGDLTWLDGSPTPGSRAGAAIVVRAAAAGLYRPGWGIYTIQRADGVTVGAIGFNSPPEGGRAEIGYNLSDSARGNGYATDAVRTLAAWALGQPEAEAVTALTEPDNLPSQQVLERAGFRRGPDTDTGLRSYELTAAGLRAGDRAA